ncbi:hypothetical protein V1478_010416 [Vespula squamosa]|uniref:Uncharacterized protein n=1 Tax=Vespula squamosa TaxID=30214 RepID=A0ABD2AHZ5_VESSQ
MQNRKLMLYIQSNIMFFIIRHLCTKKTCLHCNTRNKRPILLGSVCDISNDPQMSSYTNRHGAYASVFRAEHANLTDYTSAYGNTSTYVSSDVYQRRYDNGYPAVASHAMATLSESSATGREVVKRITLIASGN